MVVGGCVRDQLGRLMIHKSMDPDDMHPHMLRELADVAKALFEKSRRTGEVDDG